MRLISDLEAAESRIGSGQASPSGVVRVTAAHAFSRLFVVPKLPLFRERYPKVVVEMLVERNGFAVGGPRRRLRVAGEAIVCVETGWSRAR